MKKFFTTLAIVFTCISNLSVAQNFDIIKDINDSKDSYISNYIYSIDNKPQAFALLNNVIYFAADDGIHGSELWRSDGTKNGTYLLKDIWPEGTNGAYPTAITTSGSYIYFVASDGEHGGELWKSDGTAAGTIMVKDIAPGQQSSSPQFLTDVNGSLYFIGNDNITGTEIWTSDGTEAGTHLVKDITPGLNYQNPIFLTKVKDKLWFVINSNYSSADGIYSTDGTEAGTIQVFSSTGCGAMQTIRNRVYFINYDITYGSELWSTDGVQTKIVRDILPGNASSFPASLTNFKGDLYFTALTDVGTRQVWTSDGTEAGTVQVSNAYGGLDPQQLTPTQNYLYFVATSTFFGTGLWKSDGTGYGTNAVKNFSPATITNLTASGSDLFFSSYTTASGQELWKTDGTTTVQVKDIFKGIASSNPTFITRFKNNLLFAATNGAKGTELWRSDGTEQNTNLVKDINSVITASSNTYSYTPFNNEVYFNATTNAEGSEPWKSDGTAAGTVRIKDINPGSFNGADFHFSSFVPVNNNLLFIATEREHGTELWKTNGTEAGTQLLKDITTGTGGSYFNLDPGSVTEFHVLGNKALFSVSNNPYGGDNNLWVTDGTEAGTSSISYISPSSYIRDFTAARGKMFFNGFSYSGINTLWVTDGTSAGTRLINGINPRAASFSRTWDSLLLFNTAEGNLYVSDGTDAGTRMLKANLTTTSYDYDFFDSRSVPVNGYTVFAANDGITGAELWRTNSKTNGTLLIKDINPAGSSDPKNFTLVNNTLFFTAYDDAHGTELWKSDGTQNGTVLVKDITPGPGYQYISNLTNANGVLYFGVADSIGYLHMWQSDGTLAGTFPVQDDNLSSLHVGGFFPWMVTNNKIFFNASSYLMGGEPACGILPAANAASLLFAGKLQASDALLNWNSFNEKVITAYNLQRSLDGINFITIAKLNAAKNAANNKYEFKDKDIASLNTAKVYYRLQPLQTSGEVAQSNIVAVNINSNISIDVQPNPVANSFRLMVRSNSSQNMQVRIIDAVGNLVLSESRQLAAGNSSNAYRSANWVPGVYIVKAMLADGTTKEIKIIKQ